MLPSGQEIHSKDSDQHMLDPKLSSDLADLQDATNQLMRSTLKLREEIDILKADNLEIQASLCKIDKTSKFCKRLNIPK